MLFLPCILFLGWGICLIVLSLGYFAKIFIDFTVEASYFPGCDLHWWWIGGFKGKKPSIGLIWPDLIRRDPTCFSASTFVLLQLLLVYFGLKSVSKFLVVIMPWEWGRLGFGEGQLNSLLRAHSILWSWYGGITSNHWELQQVMVSCKLMPSK